MGSHRKCVWLLAAVLAGLAAPAQKNQEAEVAMQAAIHKEKVEGELEEAIRQYKEVLTKFKNNRPVAAQALVHIGQCYEKLGKGEAQKAYEQVVQEYADQAEALKVARQRLAVLRTPDKKSGTELAVRKVWAGPLTDTMGEISPDGRYLSFVDWDTGDLAIRNLETGENRRLTNKGTWKESDDFALYSRWSPDGKQLAYDWYIDRPNATPNYTLELRVITVANSQSRVLYKMRGEKEWLETADWSPDGKWIAAVRSAEDNKTEIVLVSASDGSVRVLETLGREWPRLPMFSPDGRYLLYSYPPREGAQERDIAVLSVGEKQAPVLIKHPALDRPLGWSPDGKWVFFLSDRTGFDDLWAIRIKGGKPQGEAQLIKPALGRAQPLGVAKGGSFCYGITRHASNVYVATLDPRTGKVLAPPVKAVRRFEGVNDWPQYSPDGKRLAYVAPRRPGALSLSVLCIRSLDTGEHREYPTEYRRLAGPHWAPDGRAVFVAAAAQQGWKSLIRIDLQTGEVSPAVVAPEDHAFRAHEVCGDGDLIYVRIDKSRASSIIRRDLASGEETELYHGAPRDIFTIALSPDGRRLAFFNRPLGQAQGERIVRVMPATGGQPREIFRFTPPGSPWFPLSWSADGKYLLLPRKMSPDDAKQSLWRLPVDGGAPEKLDLEMRRFNAVSAHPDGRQIAFGGWEGGSSEVWVMENLFSELKAAEP